MERTRSGRRGQPVTSATDSSVVLSRPGVNRPVQYRSCASPPGWRTSRCCRRRARPQDCRWCYRDAGTSARSGPPPSASSSAQRSKGTRLPAHHPGGRPYAPDRRAGRRTGTHPDVPRRPGPGYGPLPGDTWPTPRADQRRQAVRPSQSKFTDRCTGELVDLLFASRARKVSSVYINNTVIPMSAARPASPWPTRAETSPVTGHAQRSPARSTTLRSR